MTINSNTHRCSYCYGLVRNVEGRRKTIEQLTTIHNETCPGARRGRKETTS
jgi:hypothetical protein